MNAEDHVANEEVIQWQPKENTGFSALLARIQRSRAAARRSRMLSSQQRHARRLHNKSGMHD